LAKEIWMQPYHSFPQTVTEWIVESEFSDFYALRHVVNTDTTFHHSCQTTLLVIILGLFWRTPGLGNELWKRKLGCNFRAVHVRILTDKVTMGKVFIWKLRCLSVKYSTSASDSFTCRMRGRTMSEIDAAVSRIVPWNWTTTSSLLASAVFKEDVTPRSKHAVRVN
jgi:hypothetical protein